MNLTVYPRTVALFPLVFAPALSAQQLDRLPGAAEASARVVFAAPASTHALPQTNKVSGALPAEEQVLVTQEMGALELVNAPRKVMTDVVDFAFLKTALPKSAQLVRFEVSSENLRESLAEVAAAYREESSTPAAGAECAELSLSIRQQVAMDPSQVLELVDRAVRANPSCSCEIVKAAIAGCDGGVEEVVAIARAAIEASPESLRIISQCAIAACPDSISAIQALVAEYDPHAGKGDSAKGSKDAKDAKEVAPIVTPPNPLDRVPPPLWPPIPPTPPVLTDVNP